MKKWSGLFDATMGVYDGPEVWGLEGIRKYYVISYVLCYFLKKISEVIAMTG